MKLYSPQFRKALKRGVKKSIRASRELKREYRRARRGTRIIVPPWCFHLLISLGLGVIAVNLARNTGHPATGLEAVTLWAFAWVFFHGGALRTLLHHDRNILATLFLPIPEADIFRWQWSKFVGKTLASIPGFALCFVPLGYASRFTVWQWLAVPVIAVIMWFVVFSLAVVCARLPRRIILNITIWTSLLGFVSVIFTATTSKGLINILDQLAPGVNCVLPTGWAVSLFELLLQGRNVSTLFFLAPICLLAIPLKLSIRALQSSFRYKEYILPVAQDILPQAYSRDPSLTQPGNVGVTEIEEIIMQRKFLEPVKSPGSGWLEGLFWRWLTPREKALAGFAFPNGCSFAAAWLKMLRGIAWHLAIGCAAAFLMPAFRPYIMAFVLLLPGLLVLAKIDDAGRAFSRIVSNGVIIPVYACYGIGYRELSRLLVKYSVMQLFLIVPLFMIMAKIAFWFYAVTWQPGFLFGLKSAAVLFAARYYFLLFAFSSATNDNRGFRIKSAVILLLLIGFGMAFAASAIATLVMPRAVPAFGLFAITMLNSWLIWNIYGLFYNRSWFDLMNIPVRR